VLKHINGYVVLVVKNILKILKPYIILQDMDKILSNTKERSQCMAKNKNNKSKNKNNNNNLNNANRNENNNDNKDNKDR